MDELKIIPVTIEKYCELFRSGQIDETAIYKIIVDDEVLGEE